MKQKIGSLLLFAGLVFLCSCSKKEKKETELTPTNALEQYSGVMIKAKRRAEGMTELLPLKQLIDSFRAQEGRNPSSLQELVEKGYTQEIPRPPAGKHYVYDPNTGSVTLQ
ncbi:MAG TPA: hypothetical protein PKW42_00715 [bacterium]|nr:hypothetical protein [bacterium]HPP11233.1 hypothetical protein [bacterium]